MIEGIHRYLRAYLAGIAFPTAFLAVILIGFVIFTITGNVSWSASRLLIFPMAVVPNLWGLWNIAYAFVSKHRAIPIGLFGAGLPVLIAPAMYVIGKAIGYYPLTHQSPTTLIVAFILATLAYFLVWKHIVGALNRVLDLD